jgi:hypothetical protein
MAVLCVQMIYVKLVYLDFTFQEVVSDVFRSVYPVQPEVIVSNVQLGIIGMQALVNLVLQIVDLV